MGQGEAMVRAAGHNFMKPINGLAQLVEHGVAGGLNYVAPGSSVAKYAQGVSDSDDAALAQNEADYQKAVPDGIGAGIGATVGSIAPFLLGTGEASAVARGAGADATLAARAGQAAQAATANAPGIVRAVAPTAARVGTLAAQGGAYGALTPVTNQDPDQSFAQQKLGQIGEGAVGGAVAGPVGSVLGRVLSPVGNAAVNTLQAAGIRPTFGQAMGPVGSSLEQKAASLPFVGDLINSARGRAVGDFNRAIGNDALAPIGETLPGDIAPGSDMVAHVRDTIGQRFDQIARNGQVVMDPALQSDIANLQNGIAQDAPSLAGRFNNLVNNQLLNKNGGNLTGDQWADSRSMIGEAIRAHSGPTATSDDAQMVNYLNGLQDALTANAEYHSNTSVAQNLQQANTAYARYKVMEKAAGGTGAQKADNTFTPAQYLNAARGGQSAFQRATSSGGGQGYAQNLATTAQPLLGATVPDSGTAGRNMIGGLLALHNPVVALKAGVAAVPYLPGIRNVAPLLATARGPLRALASPARVAAPYVGGMLAQPGQGAANASYDPNNFQATNAGLLN
ncbi:hypothetical protein [Paraburkholderia oxyphila]|uniref:hypothetical protein n=1 Tax=Paraburkholderia oxyphila TaxID=614212 RepID=UPI0012EED2E2|nr:hypothetical protein [Paraburkholderia oxyphila]